MANSLLYKELVPLFSWAYSGYIRQMEDMMFRVKYPSEEDYDSNEGREKRNALIPHLNGATLWENGIVPYEITSAFDGKILPRCVESL